MSGRPASPRWLVFLVVTGPLILLLRGRLHPVMAPVSLGLSHHWELPFDTVRFRAIWATEGLRTAPGWLAAEAVLALVVGAGAACIRPPPADRR